jgi:hypothetical protein
MISNSYEVYKTMRNLLIVTLASVSLLALAACGSSAAQTSNSTGGTEASAGKTTSSATVSQPAGSTTLGETYKDALPIVAQLTLGSLKLDSDASAAGAAQDLSIDADEAGKLLPLWQAYQSLSNSDNTAAAELDALVSQIQDTMRLEQVQAIAAMQLTADDIGEVLQAQGPGAFGGGFEGRNGATTGGGNAGPGGFAGPPPGDFPGGGPGGGGPGGVPGGGFANASPEQRATAIAERMAQDGGQAATFMTRGLLNQLITSLRIKTGDLTEAEVQAQQQQRAITRWLPVVSETTGIAVEDLNTAITGGASLAEAIKDKGGDVTAVETALREALKNNPNLDEQAIKDQIASVLNTKVTPQ